MPPKLSENEALKFVQLYREHECLWNFRCDDYRNRKKRVTALQQIRKEMAIEGLDINEIKAKIKNIRSTYYLELNKIEKSTRSGARGKIYKPRAKWFEELHAFIKNVSVRRSVTSNMKKENTNDDSEQGSSSKNVCTLPESPQSPISLSPVATLATATFTPRIRTKRSKISQMALMINKLKKMQDDRTHKTDEGSDFDFFGKSVSSQLKKLSEEQAAIAQEGIQGVLTRCRLADIRAKQSNSAFSFQNTQYTQSTQTQYSQSNPSTSPPPENSPSVVSGMSRES